MTKQVHFIMQGKGGVGKTLISTILTQYLLSIDKKVLCLDTDPVNKSFTRFKSLNVDSIPLLKNDSIDPHHLLPVTLMRSLLMPVHLLLSLLTNTLHHVTYLAF